MIANLKLCLVFSLIAPTQYSLPVINDCWISIRIYCCPGNACRPLMRGQQGPAIGQAFPN
jgi:hypothetical protein